MAAEANFNQEIFWTTHCGKHCCCATEELCAVLVSYFLHANGSIRLFCGPLRSWDDVDAVVCHVDSRSYLLSLFTCLSVMVAWWLCTTATACLSLVMLVMLCAAVSSQPVVKFSRNTIPPLLVGISHLKLAFMYSQKAFLHLGTKHPQMLTIKIMFTFDQRLIWVIWHAGPR